MTLPDKDQMYRALLERDPAFDGVFFVAVKTTGIFCRPVCTAKKPKPENVEFFAQARDALYAGFRPCKVCRPLDKGEKQPDWVRKLLQLVDERPTQRIRDLELRRIGVAPERARRFFKSRYGMTFQGYHRARRMGLALKQIRNGGDAVDAAIEQGYDSDSGFRDAFAKILGAPPAKASGVEAMLARWIETPLGPMIAAANDEGLCLLEFVDRRMLPAQIETLRRRFGCAIVPGESPNLDSIEKELASYFAGALRGFRTPVVLKGSEFQVAVWKELLKVPYGETRSYGDIARRLSSGRVFSGFQGSGARTPENRTPEHLNTISPTSTLPHLHTSTLSRAVGRANGDNRLAIVVPCHRVIGADGKLTGYGGGLWRKQRLLDLERGKNALF